MANPDFELPPQDFTYDPKKPGKKVVEIGRKRIEIRDTNSFNKVLEAYVRSLGEDQGEGSNLLDPIVQEPIARALLDGWREKHPERFKAVVAMTQQSLVTFEAQGRASVIGRQVRLGTSASFSAEHDLLCSDIMGDLLRVAQRDYPGYNPYELGV